jgi:hypothetical protein
MAAPPIKSKTALFRASADRLGDYVCWEFRELLGRNELSQENIAHSLDVSGQSVVSKWLTRERMLPGHVVAKLDAGLTYGGRELDCSTTYGLTWGELATLHRRARKRAAVPSPVAGERYDAFLASPMAATAGTPEYQAERNAAIELKAALETYCDMRVYYAGTNLRKPREFDANDAAAEMNFRALSNSDYFVLLVTARLTRPSSVFVEAGWALAAGIPSLYLFPDPEMLPYCLKNINQHQASDVLPPVIFYNLRDYGTATDFIETQGKSVFERLYTISRNQPR